MGGSGPQAVVLPPGPDPMWAGRGRGDGISQGLDPLPQPADLHGGLQRQVEGLVGVAHDLGRRRRSAPHRRRSWGRSPGRLGDQAEDRVLGRADPLAAHLHRHAVAEETAVVAAGHLTTRHPSHDPRNPETSSPAAPVGQPVMPTTGPTHSPRHSTPQTAIRHSRGRGGTGSRVSASAAGGRRRATLPRRALVPPRRRNDRPCPPR